MGIFPILLGKIFRENFMRGVFDILNVSRRDDSIGATPGPDVRRSDLWAASGAKGSM